MQYNIHPILVHFPIALLFIYSVIKIIPFKKIMPAVNWKDAEKVLLFFGVISAFVARATGELAEELTGPNHQLVENHEFFAGLTIFIYSVLLAGVLAGYLATRKYMPMKGLFLWIEKTFADSWFTKLLALAGLTTLMITGLLGGVMVYGLTADPLAPYVLNLLGITL